MTSGPVLEQRALESGGITCSSHPHTLKGIYQKAYMDSTLSTGRPEWMLDVRDITGGFFLLAHQLYNQSSNTKVWIGIFGERMRKEWVEQMWSGVTFE